MSKYYKAKDIMEIFSDESRPENWMGTETEIQEQVDFDFYKSQIENLPTIEVSEENYEEKYDEWCHDCKEYDKEKHCCPRWNRVIRQTVAEVSEDAISRSKLIEGFEELIVRAKSPYLKRGIRWAIGNTQSASSVVPKELSEDCSDYYKGYCARYEDGCFQQCKNAPSVVPTQTNTNQCVESVGSVGRAEREWLNTIGDCNICRFAGCSECDDCINGSQWVRMTEGDEE